MDALTEFLLDRIAEREQIVRTATVWPEEIVLREIALCSALRFILSEHLPVQLDEVHIGGCRRCRTETWPCPTLAALATAYAAHPAFDARWALSSTRH